MENIKGNIKQEKIESKLVLEVTKSVLYSLMGIIIFFVPIKINGYTKTLIHHMSNYLKEINIGFLLVSFIVLTAFTIVSDIYISKKDSTNINKVNVLKKSVSIVIIIFIFYNKDILFMLSYNNVFIIEEIILNSITILPISSIFIPLICDYGFLELVESYCQKFMKKMFRISGKNVVIIMIYLLTDIYTGMFVAKYLYDKGRLRENEFFIILVNFSIMSVFISNYMISEMNVGYIKTILMGIFIYIISNCILVRIYPINKKKKRYSIKTSYKECNFRGKNKKTKAIESNIKNRGKNSCIKRMILSFDKCLNLITILVPNMVIMLVISILIIENTNVENIYKVAFSNLGETLKIKDMSQILEYLSYNVVSIVFSIDKCLENVNIHKEFITIFSVFMPIGLSTTYVFIKSIKINIKTSEIIIVYIQKIILFLALYSLIIHLQIGYLL